MQRRNLLKAVAAGGLASIASTAAAGTSVPMRGPIEGLDSLYVVRGEDEVVRTVEGPTGADLKRMQELLRPGEAIVNSDSDCWIYCYEDCQAACPDESCNFLCSCGDDCRLCCDASLGASFR